MSARIAHDGDMTRRSSLPKVQIGFQTLRDSGSLMHKQEDIIARFKLSLACRKLATALGCQTEGVMGRCYALTSRLHMAFTHNQGTYNSDGETGSGRFKDHLLKGEIGMQTGSFKGY